MALASSLMYSKTIVENVPDNISIGPNIGINKNLLKRKVSTSLSYARNNAYIGNNLNSVYDNVRLRIGYKVNKNSQISINGSYMKRNDKVQNGQSFSEYRGSVSYGYNF